MISFTILELLAAVLVLVCGSLAAGYLIGLRVSERNNLFRKELEGFVDDVDASGGATFLNSGEVVLVADPEWYDLARRYEVSCALLERDPKLDW